jgi:hypothetical protein
VNRYDIKLYCRAGTIRMRYGAGAGPCWEDVMHWLTWCSEYTYEAARQTVRNIMHGDRGRHNIKKATIVFVEDNGRQTEILNWI